MLDALVNEGDILILQPQTETKNGELVAARLVGAAAVGLLGQLAVNMPGGYFGPAEEVTRFGLWYALASMVLGVAAAAQEIRSRRQRHGVGVLLVAANVAVFLPAMAEDPVIAGGVVAWNLTILATLLLPSAPSVVGRGDHGRDADPLIEWVQLNGAAVRHLAAVAVLVTIAVAGYGLGARAPAKLLVAALNAVVIAVTVRFLWRRAVAGPRRLVVLALVCLGASLASAANIEMAFAWLAVFEILLLAHLVAGSRIVEDLVATFLGQPTAMVVVSFVILIAVGSVLLSVPAAAAGDEPIAPMNALFTATSAACVTGLVVVDTGSAYSAFGQVVILALIQCGGLNIMLLSLFAARLFGGGVGIRGERALGEMLDIDGPLDPTRIIGFLLVVTATVEGVGAAVLTWSLRVPGDTVGSALWRGIFHSVSAFCNAGFALQPDSLCGSPPTVQSRCWQWRC